MTIDNLEHFLTVADKKNIIKECNILRAFSGFLPKKQKDIDITDLFSNLISISKIMARIEKLISIRRLVFEQTIEERKSEGSNDTNN